MRASTHPSLASRFWADLNTRDFRQLDEQRTVAVLPLGATEQHGPHLPLGVDTLLVQGIVDAAIAQLPAELPVLFLPTLAIGLSPEHARFPGTLTYSPETLIRMWTELGAGVARSGVKKLVFFNAHGGHVAAMDLVARELRARHGLIVYSVSWFQLDLGDAASHFSADELRFGVHAGEVETSMMLALAPDLVRMHAARNFESTARQRAAAYPVIGDGKSAKLGWAMEDYNADGAAGNAAAADATRGKSTLDAAASRLAALLAEVSSLPLTTANTAPLP